MASDIRATDPEATAGSGYAPIPASDVAGGGDELDRRWLPGVLAAICGSLLLLAALAAGLTRVGGEAGRPSVPAAEATPSRGVSEGVSEKAVRSAAGVDQGYPWTNAMLTWQRTAFHFQPEKNWMNDPNGRGLVIGNVVIGGYVIFFWASYWFAYGQC